MRLRGNPDSLLVDAHILVGKHGVHAGLDQAETLYMTNRTRIRVPQDLVEIVRQEIRANP